jgi:hypothetical protein
VDAPSARIRIYHSRVTQSALAVRVGVAALFVACVGGAFYLGTRTPEGLGPGASMRATPTVVLAVRDLSRLESESYHVEKVVELTDAQSKLFGLVEAKDAILLVAVGDVVAGVDLSSLSDADVRADDATHTVHVTLPAPEVFSASLDATQTHVYERRTDVLASRNEKLEGLARSEAEKQMRQAAIDEGILTRAKASAERTVRGLLRSLGYTNVDVRWAGG